MALQAKVLSVGSDVLTDLRPGRVRRTLYAERSPALTPLAAFLIGTAVAPLILGAGKALAGGSARSEGKEKLESDLIAAKIAGETAKAAEIRGRIALIAREFDPVSEEERALKLQALRDSVPYDEQRRDISLESERAKVAREDELFPLVLRAQEIANETAEALNRERAERHAEALQTERVRRQQAAEEADLRERLVEQREREREREAFIPTQLGPIGALSVVRRGEAIGGLTGLRISSF